MLGWNQEKKEENEDRRSRSRSVDNRKGREKGTLVGSRGGFELIGGWLEDESWRRELCEWQAGSTQRQPQGVRDTNGNLCEV